MVRGSVVCRPVPASRFALPCSLRATRPRPPRQPGAEVVGFDDLAAEVKAGNLNFDVVIATPDAMKLVSSARSSVRAA